MTMTLSLYQLLPNFLISPARPFEIGSLQTKISVIVLLAFTLWVASIVPGTTLLARLPKWILVLMSIGLLIAQAIFTLGSQLAGVIYWSSCSLAAEVLLPFVAVLLVIGLRRGEPPRFVALQFGACFLVGTLCLVTR